jgi:hypothetical protein
MKNEIKELNRLRAFKVETLSATDNKPTRIKLTDLRYSKTVILSYGAKHNSLKDVIEDFFNKIGIELTAQTWAEDKNSIHLYGIYLTENFDIQIK